MTHSSASVQAQLDRLQRYGLIAGVIGGVGLLLGLILGFVAGDLHQFFQSYLYAFLFLLALSLGPLAALMLQYLTGGRWGLAIRRPLEAGTRTLWLTALLFIPILFGIPYLYEWSHADVVAEDTILQWKAPYLNTPFFIIRAVIYFAIWLGLAYFLNRWSRAYDASGDAVYERRFRMISGLGIPLYVLTLTFATTDWAMSLEPHWFSTIYGVIYLIGQAMTTLAVMIVLLALLGDKPPLNAVVNPNRIHDIGKLLFAMVVLWAYTGFAQYVITWTGNLAEFTPWYFNRVTGGWEYLAILLITCQFIVPFFLLLSRRFKRTVNILVIIASALLVMRLVDLFWIVKPAFSPGAFAISWLDPMAVLAMSGAWLWLMARNLKSLPLLPIYDSRMIEATRPDKHHEPSKAGKPAAGHH